MAIKKTPKTTRPQKRIVKRDWTDEEYASEAREWVACYGKNYCWDEFIYEYVKEWEHRELRRPDPDKMRAAIYKAE